MTRAYAERRHFVLERLATLSLLSTVPPAGTFYCFVDVSGMLGRTVRGRALDNAGTVTEALRDLAEVSVVSGVGFGAPDHIRISFAGSMDALKEGFHRIECFVENDLAE